MNPPSGVIRDVFWRIERRPEGYGGNFICQAGGFAALFGVSIFEFAP